MPNVPINFDNNSDVKIDSKCNCVEVIAECITDDIPVAIQSKLVQTSVNITKSGNVNIDFSQSRKCECTKIFYNTTHDWNTIIGLIPEKGSIYIYSDYITIHDKVYPGLKIGDGNTYLSDLPFIDQPIYEHIRNSVIHVTQEDRNIWDSKVTAKVGTDEDLILEQTRR